MGAVDVLGEGVLGALGHLADGALVGDARHDVALLGVAPHALPAADELAARPAHEPAGRRHHVALHEGADVARSEGPRLAAGAGLLQCRRCKYFVLHFSANSNSVRFGESRVKYGNHATFHVETNFP